MTTDGAAVTFYAKVANAGVYDTSFRYSNGSGDGKSLSIYVNGEYVGNLNMPNTDNWNTWNTVSKELELAAGKNAITVKYDDAYRKQRKCEFGLYGNSFCSNSNHCRS